MIVEKVEEFLEKISGLNVLVAGETIIDEFVPVSYEGQSMKSMCPVFKLEGNSVKQSGGAAAIANHLQDFVKKVTLVTNTKEEILKTRYVDVSDGKKHVEINRFNSSGFEEIKIDTKKYDAVIIADFGHGFCDKFIISDGFHLMCQTNSNNFGFNRISKWKQYSKKSVCLDLREASLQMNKRINFTGKQEIIELFNYEMKTENLFLTIGQNGSLYTDGKKILKQKTFKSQIVDTIGAGDTFYSFSSLSATVNQPGDDDLMLIPSLAASLSTTWLCNEKSVNKKSLLEYAAKFI